MVCGLQDDKLAAELNDIQDVEVIGRVFVLNYDR